LAYRCLVKNDDREAPSFLLESVVGGDQTGRYSFVGSHPALEVVAKESEVTVLNHEKGERVTSKEDNPIDVPARLSRGYRAHNAEGLPDAFCGGWVGYTGYDSVRYVEGGKLPFASAPPDDRDLPDIHLGLYKDVLVFDNAQKVAYAVHWVFLEDHESVKGAFEHGIAALGELVEQVSPSNAPTLPSGKVGLSTSNFSQAKLASNMSKGAFLDAVARVKEYILSGDAFQIVLSHRFERRTFADPFEIYRSLRIVNPSPYMIYLQARGAIMVASSPEILCRVTKDAATGQLGVVNRPLAGTRRRGKSDEEDKATEDELLADEKEVAEHTMLVDLGRNDVGRVSENGSVVVEKLMQIERYSHVMHISSTVTGLLKQGVDAWAALQAALPAGTVSGAPKVRAMQIIDELEVARRGPYGGGIGLAGFNGTMDMALALRTMVIPTGNRDTLYDYTGKDPHPRREWLVHLQAGAGIVADSVPEAEYEETVNKSGALSRAVDLAEAAFLSEDDE
jgi:anthranilate synthase component 1